MQQILDNQVNYNISCDRGAVPVTLARAAFGENLLGERHFDLFDYIGLDITRTYMVFLMP